MVLKKVKSTGGKSKGIAKRSKKDEPLVVEKKSTTNSFRAFCITIHNPSDVSYYKIYDLLSRSSIGGPTNYACFGIEYSEEELKRFIKNEKHVMKPHLQMYIETYDKGMRKYTFCRQSDTIVLPRTAGTGRPGF